MNSGTRFRAVFHFPSRRVGGPIEFDEVHSEMTIMDVGTTKEQTS